MKEMGLGLVITGVVAGLIAWFLPVSIETSTPGLYGISVPSSVVNLQKLQVQMMVWHGALAAIVAGCVLIAGAEIRAAMTALNRSGLSPIPSAPTQRDPLIADDGTRLRGPAAMAAMQAAQEASVRTAPEWEDKPDSSVRWSVAIGLGIMALIALVVAFTGNPDPVADNALANAEAIADNLEARADEIEAASRNLR